MNLTRSIAPEYNKVFFSLIYFIYDKRFLTMYKYTYQFCIVTSMWNNNILNRFETSNFSDDVYLWDMYFLIRRNLSSILFKVNESDSSFSWSIHLGLCENAKKELPSWSVMLITRSTWITSSSVCLRPSLDLVD